MELVRELNPQREGVYHGGLQRPDTPGDGEVEVYAGVHTGTDGILAIEENSGKWKDYNSLGIVAVDLPDEVFSTRSIT